MPGPFGNRCLCYLVKKVVHLFAHVVYVCFTHWFEVSNFDHFAFFRVINSSKSSKSSQNLLKKDNQIR